MSSSRVYWPRCVANFSFSYAKGKKASISLYVKSMSGKKTSYREAATFTIVVDFGYLPFDPRMLVNAQVAIFIGNCPGNIPLSLTKENLLFLGFILDIKNDNAKVEITMHGADYSVLFLENRGNFQLPSIGQSIIDIFEQVKEQTLGAGRLKIEYRGVNAAPIVSQALGDVFATSSLGKFVRKDGNAWEFMQSVAMAVGLVCYLELDTIVIADPSHFRTDQDKEAYCFGYPVNTENIVIQRKHGRYSSLQVIVKSLQGDQVLTAVYPENPIVDYQVDAVPVDGTQDQFVVKQRPIEPVVQIVSGNFTIDALNLVARRVYTALRSYQTTAQVTIADLEVYNRNSQKEEKRISVFSIKIGDNMKIIDSWDVYSGVNVLQQRGYSAEIAEGIAEAQKDLQRIYYIDTIDFNFTNTQGLKVNIYGLSRLKLNGAAEEMIH